MGRIISLDINREELTFSAGHFTIFSATERESLHGHNYSVSLTFKALITENGLAFDYRHYKQALKKICATLDHRFLLPANSPYLQLEDKDDYLIAHFNQQKIPFLKEDVVILPLTNITIEELSYWFLQKIIEDKATLVQHHILALFVSVHNGPGQSGGASWEMPTSN